MKNKYPNHHGIDWNEKFEAHRVNINSLLQRENNINSRNGMDRNFGEGEFRDFSDSSKVYPYTFRNDRKNGQWSKRRERRNRNHGAKLL